MKKEIEFDNLSSGTQTRIIASFCLGVIGIAGLLAIGFSDTYLRSSDYEIKEICLDGYKIVPSCFDGYTQRDFQEGLCFLEETKLCKTEPIKVLVPKKGEL